LRTTRISESLRQVDTVDGVPIVIAIPRPGWKPFFAQRQAELDRIEAESSAEKGTDRERETGLEPATTYLEGRRSTS
jgi:hypothetical protein